MIYITIQRQESPTISNPNAAVSLSTQLANTPLAVAMAIAKGDKGEQGVQGIQGIKGDTGNTGKSAYELAVDAGFVGTLAQWVASVEASRLSALDSANIATQKANEAKTLGFLGVWNASTNTPTLTTTPNSSLVDGAHYKVTVAGTQAITGSSVAFGIGDEVKKVGSSWVRVPNVIIAQNFGTDSTIVMSQKAVTEQVSFIPKIVTKNYSQLNVVNNQSKPRANYPVNNWVFIPTRSVAAQNGYIDSVLINLTNAQASRTVKVIILDKSGTSFTTRVISDAVLAEAAGTQTLTLTSALQVTVGQYIGFQVTTSNTANSVGYIDSGGPSYTDWGGWSANNPTVSSGSSFVGDVQSDKRLFDFVSNFYVNVTTLDAPSRSEFDTLNASTVKNTDINPTLIKSPESTVANIVNNLITAGRGTRLSYPVSANLFIPILPATTDLSIIQFSVDLVNAQVGRTIQFYVLSKSGTTFTIKYVSSTTPAELAGINVLNLTSVVKILSGDFIGVKVTTADTANSIAYISTGGPHYADFGGWKVSVPPSNIGDIISNPPTEPDSRGFAIQAVGYVETYIRSNHRNVSDGFVGLNSSNRIPNSISKESDYWAGKKIVWVGTSIPAGGTKPYPNLVGQMLNCTVDNQAVGSSGMIWNGTRGLTLSATIAELTAVFGSAYAPQSYQNKVIGKGADLLVIDHGYNDATSATGANLGAIDSTDKSTFYGSLNFVIQQALLDNPLLKIMFVTPPNRYEAVGANSGYTIAQIDNVRAAIFNLAKKYNAPVCDLAYISNIHSLNYTSYKYDGVHPFDGDRPRLASFLYNSILGIA